MIPATEATLGRTEDAQWWRSGEEDVFAIVSAPCQPTGVAVILVHSGVHTMTAHNGRVWVGYSRELRAAGHLVLRFDFAGSGDSGGSFERRLDAQAVLDVCTAVDRARALGARQVVIVGHCFGGLAAAAAALERPAVDRVVMLAPPIAPVVTGQTTIQAGGRSTVKEGARALVSWQVARRVARDADYRRWLAQRVTRRATLELGVEPRPVTIVAGLRELDVLSARGTRVDLYYGHSDRLLQDFRRECDGPLGPVVARPSVTIHELPGSVHSLVDEPVQRRVLADIAAVASDLAACP